jgi:DNA processing protein
MTGAIDGACRECLRRVWLLSRLSVRLDYHSRNQGRLAELLALEDRELIEAIGGRWRKELKERWERFEIDEPDKRDAKALDTTAGVATVCRHCPGYPSALRARRGAPRVLHVVGGTERLRTLTAEPVVAIIGSTRATDYGMEMARSLARGLAASGVTIVSGFANGIVAGAHAGALEVEGPTVTVMAGGVDVIKPAGRRTLYKRVTACGCAVAEPPCGYLERPWCEPARARTVAGLARLTIVVEADEDPRALIGARAARALGQTTAAVPGRVTSPVSRGTNALLMEGAPMVRGPEDALDLLYGLGTPGLRAAHERAPHEREPASPGRTRSRPRRLEPRLQAMLEQVGAGRDTPGKLTCDGEDPGETLLALTELELMGLLGRGDGGRYVPRESLAGR